MPQPLDQYTASINSLSGRMLVPMGGTFIACTASDEDFEISFDGGPFVPFGPGRSFAPLNPDGSPAYFLQAECRRRPGFSLSAPSITLIVGTAAYRDNRVALYTAQTIRSTPATTVSGSVITLPNTIPWPLNNATGVTFQWNIRNPDTSTTNIIVGSDSTQVAAGNGMILRPGENYDFPCGLLYVKGAAAATFEATSFTY